jgi:hypothetical protein
MTELEKLKAAYALDAARDAAHLKDKEQDHE